MKRISHKLQFKKPNLKHVKKANPTLHLTRLLFSFHPARQQIANIINIRRISHISRAPWQQNARGKLMITVKISWNISTDRTGAKLPRYL